MPVVQRISMREPKCIRPMFPRSMMREFRMPCGESGRSLFVSGFSRRIGGFGREFVEIFFQPGIAIGGDGLGTDGIVGIDVVSDLGIAGYQRPVHEYPPKNSRARKWDAAREEGKRSMGETRWEISGHTGNHTPLLFLRPIPTDGVSRARRLDSHV